LMESRRRARLSHMSAAMETKMAKVASNEARNSCWYRGCCFRIGGEPHWRAKYLLGQRTGVGRGAVTTQRRNKEDNRAKEQ
jgi:hypothetical protein